MGSTLVLLFYILAFLQGAFAYWSLYDLDSSKVKENALFSLALAFSAFLFTCIMPLVVRLLSLLRFNASLDEQGVQQFTPYEISDPGLKLVFQVPFWTMYLAYQFLVFCWLGFGCTNMKIKLVVYLSYLIYFIFLTFQLFSPRRHHVYEKGSATFLALAWFLITKWAMMSYFPNAFQK